MNKWKFVSEEIKCSTPIFTLVQHIFEYPPEIKSEQPTFPAYVLKMPHWVNIIALNKRKEFILIRQFRFGNREIELEIPAGLIDENEDPLMAAKRELEEETGYVSGNWIYLGKTQANPAIQDNDSYTYLAVDCEVSGIIQWDLQENIDIELASEKKVDEYIQSGEIKNTFVIAAFFWYQRYKAKQS